MTAKFDRDNFNKGHWLSVLDHNLKEYENLWELIENLIVISQNTYDASKSIKLKADPYQCVYKYYCPKFYDLTADTLNHLEDTLKKIIDSLKKEKFEIGMVQYHLNHDYTLLKDIRDKHGNDALPITIKRKPWYAPSPWQKSYELTIRDLYLRKPWFRAAEARIYKCKRWFRYKILRLKLILKGTNPHL